MKRGDAGSYEFARVDELVLLRPPTTLVTKYKYANGIGSDGTRPCRLRRRYPGRELGTNTSPTLIQKIRYDTGIVYADAAWAGYTSERNARWKLATIFTRRRTTMPHSPRNSGQCAIDSVYLSLD